MRLKMSEIQMRFGFKTMSWSVCVQLHHKCLLIIHTVKCSKQPDNKNMNIKTEYLFIRLN